MRKQSIHVSLSADKITRLDEFSAYLKVPISRIIESFMDYSLEKGWSFTPTEKAKMYKIKNDPALLAVRIWKFSGSNSDFIITQKNIYDYFIAQGLTEKTATQYSTKNIPQNPGHALYEKGLCIKSIAGYILDESLRPVKKWGDIVEENKTPELVKYVLELIEAGNTDDEYMTQKIMEFINENN